jgi:hypothetical protein
VLARLALTALAALAFAAPAEAKQFTVSFTGKGNYLSDYSTTTSRDFQDPNTGETFTGSCTDYRHEDTDLSWSIPFKFGLKGGTATDKGAAVAPGHLPESAITNDTRPGSGADGCAQPDGSTLAGKGDCVGHTLPDGDQRLRVSKAGKGKTNLAIEGPRFKGTDFGGNWTYGSGSCAQNYNGRTLGLPDGPSFPIVIAVAFPVKTKTWASLKKGHYFRVKVKPGHYAADGLLPLQCSAGCVRKLSWTGVVRVTRVK